MIKISHFLLKKWILRNYSRIDAIKKSPFTLQEKWFKILIKEGSKTEFGKKYNFSSITSFNDFKEIVPIQDYESLKDYIFKTMRNNQKLLWSDNIKWFSKSSGTTSDKSKFIPISKTSLNKCHYRGGIDLFSIYFKNNPSSKMLLGKSLVLGGNTQINRHHKFSYFGDLSAVIIKNLPFWAKIHRTPNEDIALLPKWETKLNLMAKITSNQNITNISGVPSWTLVLLRKVLELTKKKTISEVWSNLELYIHGGVSFKPYAEQFKKIIGKDINYIETYNASEGFFGIQDQFKSNNNDLLLLLDHGIFYEFIPVKQLKSSNPKVLNLSEVKYDENYALLITTNGGLWRYMIGDTIKFTSLSPFRIKITGRTKLFINVFGEELIIDNTDNAIQKTCQKHNAIVTDYTVGPIFMDSSQNRGAHQWAIEFRKEPNDIVKFAKSLDKCLQLLNSDYEAKRYQDFVLGNLQIESIPPNSFYKWMKSKNRLGGQNKVPRLHNDRKYIDDLLSFLEKN